MKDTFYFHTAPTNDKKYQRATIAGILVGNQIKFGLSKCSSKDQFVKKHGRNVAKGRALSSTGCLKTVEIPKEGNLGEWFVNQAIDILIENKVKCFIPQKKI